MGTGLVADMRAWASSGPDAEVCEAWEESDNFLKHVLYRVLPKELRENEPFMHYLKEVIDDSGYGRLSRGHVRLLLSVLDAPKPELPDVLQKELDEMRKQAKDARWPWSRPQSLRFLGLMLSHPKVAEAAARRYTDATPNLRSFLLAASADQSVSIPLQGLLNEYDALTETPEQKAAKAKEARRASLQLRLEAIQRELDALK